MRFIDEKNPGDRSYNTEDLSAYESMIGQFDEQELKKWGLSL